MPEDQLKQAIAAIRAGDKFTGKQYLIELIKVDHENELAWLWMSQVVGTAEQRRQCLEKVLQINPDNEVAIKGLAILEEPETTQESLEPNTLDLSAEPEIASPSTAELETDSAAIAEVEKKQSIGAQITDFWNTAAGKVAILGGGGLVGLLAICVVCVACTLLLGRGASGQVAEAVPVTGVSDTGTAEPTPRLEPKFTPASTPIPAPPTDTPEPTPTGTIVVPPTGTPTATPGSVGQFQEAEAPPDLQEAQVISVVDGDTIDVLINGEAYRVRYILVDTSETNGGLETFGLAATEANRQLVEGKTVLLEKDVSETDQDGRLLRYVWVNDVLVNEELLRIGLAQVAIFSPDVRYADRFLEVQQQAQAAGAGMWGSDE